MTSWIKGGRGDRACDGQDLPVPCRASLGWTAGRAGEGDKEVRQKGVPTEHVCPRLCRAVSGLESGGLSSHLTWLLAP